MQISPFGFIKILVLMICIAITLFQSYLELDIYSKHQIYFATSVEGVDKAPVLLVFCDSDPYENMVNHNYTYILTSPQMGLNNLFFVRLVGKLQKLTKFLL